MTRALRAPGDRLDERSEDFFERRVGRGTRVARLHVDDGAVRAVGGHAFTAGSQVVLGRAALTGGFRTLAMVAHELTHVRQQAPMSGHVHVQRQTKTDQKSWLPELDEILPRGVGLVFEIYRTTLLLDIFGSTLLEEHVKLIHADRGATALTRKHGVPGIVALYDARRGKTLDVAAAQQALTAPATKGRYQRKSLETLSFAQPAESPTFWFQDPASQQAGAGTTTTQTQRGLIEIDKTLSKVGSIHVRFAYPASEVKRDGKTRRLRNAQATILTAIGEVIADLGTLQWKDEAERRQKETARARAAEALRGWTSSAPLNVLIAVDPSHQELLSGTVAATTDQVYVNLQDVGDPTKLQAAIRVPLVLLQGGMVPTQGGLKDVPAASATELKSTLLHEALHAMLVRQGSDANSIWSANSSTLTITGGPSAIPKLVELIRKYLIAQEEVFAYTTEATLYPSTSTKKAEYESFVRNVASFLKKRKLGLKTLSRKIPVAQRVDRRTVPWSIDYDFPTGAVEVSIADLPTIDLLLGAYPFG